MRKSGLKIKNGKMQKLKLFESNEILRKLEKKYSEFPEILYENHSIIEWPG